MKLLNERDGLMLGICNGFQALIKLGLVPNGAICGPECRFARHWPMNTIGRHVSKMVYTKVVSNKSPWLARRRAGQAYTVNPASHGEGRFVANDEWLKKLFAEWSGGNPVCGSETGNADHGRVLERRTVLTVQSRASPARMAACLGKMAHVRAPG